MLRLPLPIHKLDLPNKDIIPCMRKVGEMDKPKIYDEKPEVIELEPGKSYAWCSCGLSENQPWCDGSHKPTPFRPHVFTVEESKKYAMCNCKHSGKMPFCDGAHKRLSAE